VILQNVGADAFAKGFYFRGLHGLTLDHCFYDGTPQTCASPEALNIDETCSSIETRNFFTQLGSTRSIGNLQISNSRPPNVFQQFSPTETLDLAVI